MIQQALHKIFSFSLALLVLLSTLSFTVKKHYCGETLVDVAVFSEAKTCGMEVEGIKTAKSCCDDEVAVVEGQNELKLSSFEDLDIAQQQFLIAFAISYANGFQPLSKEAIAHNEYSPPDLVYDIQVLDQVFLI